MKGCMGVTWGVTYVTHHGNCPSPFRAHTEDSEEETSSCGLHNLPLVSQHPPFHLDFSEPATPHPDSSDANDLVLALARILPLLLPPKSRSPSLTSLMANHTNSETGCASSLSSSGHEKSRTMKRKS